MPRERTLFERLEDPEGNAGRSITENTNRMIDSVLANLRMLLNSRHGVAAIQADYGIPDLSDVLHSFPEANAMMRKGIKTAIEKYEPRLTRVRVKSVESTDDPLALHFEITAQLITAEERRRIWFETHIDPSGEAHLQS